MVRMLCALALLLVAFAHKPVGVAATVSAYAGVNVADYILPDGTLPDLCLTGDGDHQHHAGANPCEACRIVSSVDLPSPFDGFLVNRRPAAAQLTVPQGASPVASGLRPAAPTRGPPASVA